MQMDKADCVKIPVLPVFAVMFERKDISEGLWPAHLVKGAYPEFSTISPYTVYDVAKGNCAIEEPHGSLLLPQIRKFWPHSIGKF